MKSEDGTNGHLKGAAFGCTEVIVKPTRRWLTTAYVEAVLKELENAPHGEKGKILRREGEAWSKGEVRH